VKTSELSRHYPYKTWSDDIIIVAPILSDDDDSSDEEDKGAQSQTSAIQKFKGDSVSAESSLKLKLHTTSGTYD
jgi:hypothetical protein